MSMASVGLRYYATENDIKQRKHYIYVEDALVEDPYKANNTIASAYYKMLIDQKVNYLIGNRPTVEIDEDYFYSTLTAAATKASAQGIQWAYPYVQDGMFKVKLFKTENLTPYYDNKNNLIEMHRMALEKDIKYLYVYTVDEIRKYKGSKKTDTLVEETGYIPLIQTEGAIKSTSYKSWGKVPFFKLQNNSENVYDLQPIKGLIDAYDIVLSDFANNLEDFQDVNWILKGYQGEDVGTFINEVKKYKTLKVGEGGDAKAETIDIPYEARMQMLNKCEKLIFKFGFGVDLDTLAGSSLTNVVIKAQFANLDMKCNAFSEYVTEFINDYIYYYNIYISIIGGAAIPESEITYNKSNIINEVELLEANTKQTGFISEETRLSNHPWVNDVKTETEMMQGVITIEE